MSWYEIAKKIGVLTKGTSGTSDGIKKIAASKKRLFRVAIMSCACLLMNTAATISLSVVLEDWSASSGQWLTCTVREKIYTRIWANYGFQEGERYFLFRFLRRDTCWLLFWLLLAASSFCTSPPGYEMGDDKSEEAADRRRGLLKKVCSQERGIPENPNYNWSDSSSVWKPILRNWLPLSFLSSTSACYWDPEVVFRKDALYAPICSVFGEEYSPFSNFSECS